MSNEVERNDNRDSANRLLLGMDMLGSINVSNDVDCYLMTVDQSGVLSVALDAHGIYWSACFTISVLDAAGTILASWGAGSQLADSNVGLPAAGNYYVVVAGRQVAAGDDTSYTLRTAVSPGGTAAYESESNGSSAAADPVAMGQAISGQIAAMSDVDYYAVAVDAPGLITVIFDSALPYVDARYFTISVLDAAGTVLATHVAGPDFSLNVRADTVGTYYLAVSGYGEAYTNAQYSIGASATALGAESFESEPNDSAAAANPLALGVTRCGALSSATDADYYALSAAAAGVFHITVDVPPAVGGWRASMYDSTGLLLASYAIGADCTLDIGVPEAGSYFLSLTSSNQAVDTADLYVLSVTETPEGTAGYERESNDSRSSAEALALDTTLTGQLSSRDDVDFFSVSLGTPGIIAVAFDSPTDSADFSYFTISIYDAAGMLLGAWQSGRDLRLYWEAALAGTYYVSVAPARFLNYPMTTTEPYRLTVTADSSLTNFEHGANDTPATANALTLGQAISGQFLTATDVDYYAVAVDAAAVLHLVFDAPTLTFGHRPYSVSVVDAAGAVLASATPRQGCSFDFTVPTAGTYFVALATDPYFLGTSGEDYALTVSATAADVSGRETEDNNSAATADTLILGRQILGQLSSSSDYDYYVLAVDASGILTVAFDAPTDDTYIGHSYFNITVRDAAGRVAAQRTTGCDISFDLVAAPGTYLISVDDLASYYDSGSYGLAVTESVGDPAYEDESNDTRATANVLARGTPVTGQVDFIYDRTDWFAFFAATGDTATISLDTPGSDATTARYAVCLFDAAGTQLADWTWAQGHAAGQRVIPEPGHYYVSVTTLDVRQPGTYRLSADSASGGWSDDFTASAATLATVAVGGTANGNIDIAGDSDWFRVSLDAGKHYVFDLAGAGATSGMYNEPVLRLRAADGAVLQTATGGGPSGSSRSVFVAPASGDYFVDASASRWGTGAYWISVADLDDFPASAATTGTLAVGATIDGGIDFVGDVDWIRVSLQAGQTYAFELQSGFPTLPPPVQMSLYTPDGTRIEQFGSHTYSMVAGNDGAAGTFGLTAPLSGDYYLALQNRDAYGIGAYRVSAAVQEPQDSIAALVSWANWNAGRTMGAPVSLTYSFPAEEPAEYADGTPGYQAFTPAQRDAVRAILQRYAAVCRVSFQEVYDGTAQIRFGWEPMGYSMGAGTIPRTSGNSFVGADVFVNTLAFPAGELPIPGGALNFALLHEIGHALGLKHPGNYNGGGSGSEPPYLWTGLDNTDFTVMSYTTREAAATFGTGPALLDIQALQHLYGANAASRTGDDVYAFAAGSVAQRTIWDGGGNDTLDASAQGTDCIIELEPGTFSSIGMSPNVLPLENVAIAFGAWIENARGGRGNDLMIGNGLGNSLAGNGGDDVLYGGAGNDTLRGGAGADTLNGGAGTDTFLFALQNNGSDAVADFEAGDVLRIDGANFATVTIGVGDGASLGRFEARIAADGRHLYLGTDAAPGADIILQVPEVGAGPWRSCGSDIFLNSLPGGEMLLSGAASLGQTLTANSALVDVDGIGALGYQWQSSADGSEWASIAGANGASFVLTQAEVGRQVRVLASYTDRRGTAEGPCASAATVAVVPFNTVPVARPDGYAWIEGGAPLAIAVDELLANDSDADADDRLRITAVRSCSPGVVATLADGVVRVAPGNTYNRLATGQRATARFAYTVADAVGATHEAEVAVAVLGLSSAAARLEGAATRGGDGDRAGSPRADLFAADGGAGGMAGGAGDDTYFVDDAADRVTEGAGQGADQVVTGLGSCRLDGNVENLLYVGAADFDGTGNELANSLEGAAGNDRLGGLAGNDRLSGNAGDDTLDGGLGADSLAGGLGDDTYVIDGAQDAVTEAAGAGNDTIRGGLSYVLGANLENLILTGSGNFSATGNAMDNVLVGNAGDNTLDGRGGNDSCGGGAGNDLYLLDRQAELANVTEDADAGVDTLRYLPANPGAAIDLDLGAANLANVECLTIVGSGLYNLTGNALANVLTGNAVANRLAGGAGADTLIGGAGNDIYVVDGADLIIDAAGIDSVETDAGRTLGPGLENLILTGSADIDGGGNALANRLVGNAGINVLSGGTGNDIYEVQTDGDRVVEAANGGADLVRSSVVFTLAANVENLTLVGTADIDGAGNVQANILVGNAGGNYLAGDAGNDRLDGGAGNDTLDGGTGVDTLSGGVGDDTFVIDSARDVIAETANAGTDTVQVAFAYTLGANLENLTLVDGAGDIAGTGNALGNVLTGNGGNNLLNGGAGNDTLNGGLGNDTLVGGAGIDVCGGGYGDDLYIIDCAAELATITESAHAGVDTLRIDYGSGAATTIVLSGGLANFENVTVVGTGAVSLTGNDAANVLRGNRANNFIDGGAGDDTLIGGGGRDTLTGGTGVDVFGIERAEALAAAIGDFAGGDSIALGQAAFGGLFVNGALKTGVFATAANNVFANNNARLLYNTVSGALWYDRDGRAGAAAAVQIAQFTAATRPLLQATDFAVLAQ